VDGNGATRGRAGKQPTLGTPLGSSAHALVAQGIEHRFPKPCVAGSNPAGGTTTDQHGQVKKYLRAARLGMNGGMKGRYDPTMAGRQRRSRGHIEERSNFSFRALVYAGVDPLTSKQRYLRKTARRTPWPRSS
jgi:hypothetical protein